MNALKYTEGLQMEQFKIINEVSSYNHNYYVGFGKDLLFAKSDDDNTTEWWLISNRNFHYLGESYTSEGDILHLHYKLQDLANFLGQKQSELNKMIMIWNGSASLANDTFGERYGVDWEYASKESSDILVSGRLIKVGEKI